MSVSMCLGAGLSPATQGPAKLNSWGQIRIRGARIIAEEDGRSVFSNLKKFFRSHHEIALQERDGGLEEVKPCGLLHHGRVVDERECALQFLVSYVPTDPHVASRAQKLLTGFSWGQWLEHVAVYMIGGAVVAGPVIALLMRRTTSFPWWCYIVSIVAFVLGSGGSHFLFRPRWLTHFSRSVAQALQDCSTGGYLNGEHIDVWVEALRNDKGWSKTYDALRLFTGIVELRPELERELLDCVITILTQSPDETLRAAAIGPLEAQDELSAKALEALHTACADTELGLRSSARGVLKMHGHPVPDEDDAED